MHLIPATRTGALAFCLSLIISAGCEPIDPAASSAALDGASAKQFIVPVANRTLDDMDLLFVVDSSPSMKSKQEILARSIPGIIADLIQDACVDNTNGASEPRLQACPEGSHRRVKLLRGLNVGVISSSLGGQGAEYCLEEEERHHNDKAHLLPTVRAGFEEHSPNGVLKWRGEQAQIPALVESLQEQIRAVETKGCERQAPLEAWYRFLVEPRPALSIVRKADGTAGPQRDEEGELLIDSELLKQREAFLRPQSLLAIVMLTDDDDCSAMAGGELYENAEFGFKMHQAEAMPRASSVCASNPNDACCVPCDRPELAPETCDLSSCDDASPLPLEQDLPSMRCVEQRRRFGAEFVYPVERYVQGLWRAEVRDTWSGESVPNPLLQGVGASQGQTRDPGLVYAVALAGLPWQDVATAEALDPGSSWMSETGARSTLSAPELSLRSLHVEGRPQSRWQLMIGEPGTPARAPECQGDSADSTCGAEPIAPSDPFMIQSLTPRAEGQMHPIVSASILGPDFSEAFGNLINGHEHSGDGAQALQLACSFPLEEPLDCLEQEEPCACGLEAPARQAICRSPEGDFGTTQYADGAAPSPRIVQMLSYLGDNAILGSACAPQATGSGESPGYGYRPAFASISHRLLPVDSELTGVPELEVDGAGMVNCALLEATPLNPEFDGTSYNLGCEALGRKQLVPAQEAVLLDWLTDTGHCEDNGSPSCASYRLCGIKQLTGEARSACLTEPWPDGAHESPGFCYIDPSKVNAAGEAVAGGEDNTLVANLPAGQRRMLRTVGGAPARNSVTLVSCQE